VQSKKLQIILLSLCSQFPFLALSIVHLIFTMEYKKELFLFFILITNTFLLPYVQCKKKVQLPKTKHFRSFPFFIFSCSQNCIKCNKYLKTNLANISFHLTNRTMSLLPLCSNGQRTLYLAYLLNHVFQGSSFLYCLRPISLNQRFLNVFNLFLIFSFILLNFGVISFFCSD